jgi:hypothetical protein
MVLVVGDLFLEVAATDAHLPVGGAQQLGDALARDAGDQARLDPRDRFQLGDLLGEGLLVEGVDLVQGQDLGLVGQLVAIGFQLAPDRLVGAGDVLLRGVDQVDQGGRAFDVAQEPGAQAGAYDAPSIRPGMSARTKRSLLDRSTTPRLGVRVVNG